MSPEEFSAILFYIRPYTEYIYLHVLGEPTLHPQFCELVKLAVDNGFHVNLTTNGSMLDKVEQVFADKLVRQCNVSVHAYAENIPSEQWKEKMDGVFSFAKRYSENTYFSFRLWNNGAEGASDFNEYCRNAVNSFFSTQIEDTMSRNVKIQDHIFLQNAARFSWPGQKKLDLAHKKCYALRDHIAILCDGSVVPCCLDANGDMVLGNVFTTPLDDIINCKEAVDMKQAFARNEIVNPICKDCGFIL
jgi:radical SAM protein with 4Fe4S-binding SPASM domain